MTPKLFRVVGSWPGTLYLSSRPRGGDWLEDEVSGWKRFGIDSVVSLITGDEERELDLVEEESEVRKHGLTFVSYPIPDRGVPQGRTLYDLLNRIDDDLKTR